MLHSLGFNWNEYQDTTQNGINCTCQELVPIGTKGTLIACYLQRHPHQEHVPSESYLTLVAVITYKLAIILSESFYFLVQGLTPQ